MDITAILYNDMVHDNADDDDDDDNDDDYIFLHTILHLHLYINLSKCMWRVGEENNLLNYLTCTLMYRLYLVI